MPLPTARKVLAAALPPAAAMVMTSAAPAMA